MLEQFSSDELQGLWTWRYSAAGFVFCSALLSPQLFYYSPIIGLFVGSLVGAVGGVVSALVGYRLRSRFPGCDVNRLIQNVASGFLGVTPILFVLVARVFLVVPSDFFTSRRQIFLLCALEIPLLYSRLVSLPTPQGLRLRRYSGDAKGLKLFVLWVLLPGLVAVFSMNAMGLGISIPMHQ
jgi:hypothetical protein